MKRLIVVVGLIIAIVAGSVVGFRLYTKSFSPEKIAHYEENSLSMSVQYSSPLKNGRKIFGNVVPYNQVWRTGANEATLFNTNQDLIVKNNKLKAGTYSLFTVPGKDYWEIIFNDQIGQWGIDFISKKANRDPKNDILSIKVASTKIPETYESFTIAFDRTEDKIEMLMMWDQTLVAVPITTT